MMEVQMRQDVTLREEYILKIWDNYIVANLVECLPCKVAIFDYKTCRPIIASERFYVKDCEISRIVEGIKYPDTVYRDGITIQDRNYMVRLADGRHGIYATDGEAGCTACKTSGLLIVCVHGNKVNSSVCNEQVMKLGDFFRKMGV